MPFAPVPIYGGGAGVASAVSGIQDRQDRQRDFMLQLLAHAQNQQALQQYRQSQLQQNELVKQQMADAATERANTGASNMRVGQLSRIAAGSDVPPALAQSPEAGGQVQEQQTLPSRVMSPIAGQTDTTQVPAQPSGRFLKLPSDKDVQASNVLDLRKLVAANQDTNQQANRDLRERLADEANQTRQSLGNLQNALGYYRADQAGNKPPKPTFQETDMLSNMGSAEIQAVKVLQHLKQSGLDQSNDPLDPRWNTFLAQTLKVRPVDEGKADSIQRTQYAKAILARAIMGGRPSQYVMQMIEQHLPDSKMSGKQLSGVIRDVLDEVDSKRQNYSLYSGQQIPQPVGGTTWQQFQQQENTGGGPNDIRVGGVFNGKKILKVEPVQ